MGGQTLKIRQQMYDACLQVGLEIVPMEVAAKVMAVLLEYGNNENFVYNERFVCECKYVQKRFGIDGAETPDGEMVLKIQKYVRELRSWYGTHKDDPVEKNKPVPYIPTWAHELFNERYGIDNLK